jgi:hypothetical protein
MAPADDFESRGAVPERAGWQPAALAMPSETPRELKAVQPSVAERFKGLFRFSPGRRAPA